MGVPSSGDIKRRVVSLEAILYILANDRLHAFDETHLTTLIPKYLRSDTWVLVQLVDQEKLHFTFFPALSPDHVNHSMTKALVRLHTTKAWYFKCLAPHRGVVRLTEQELALCVRYKAGINLPDRTMMYSIKRDEVAFLNTLRIR